MSEIEHPSAYYDAVQRKIKANANIGRRKRMEAAIANDSDDFKSWLLETTPPQFRELESACYNRYGSVEDEAPHLAFRAAMKAWRNEHGFRPDFIGEAINDWGGLTDNQLAYARKAFAEYGVKNAERLQAEEKRRANAPLWVEGRQTVTGVIASIRTEESDFGPVRKMLLNLEDGRKLWSSAPKTIASDKGAKITMSIDVTVKKDDPTFAYGKRPTKAVLET